ncbi:MAG: hypothetical protein U1F43_26315 [Myxococcota bacterium]
MLSPIFDDEAKLAAFNGFYDIEKPLAAAGVDRSTAIKILKYFHLDGAYDTVIKKMDSSGSSSRSTHVQVRKKDI